MANIFTLTPDIKAIAQGAIDDLIDQLGKNCLLLYPPKFVNCVNCVYDTIGQKSSNRWVNGGPMPFMEGSICPLCDGIGKRAEEVTDTIKMLIANTPADFFYPVKNISVAVGDIQTKGYLTDLPKIMRSQSMILQPDLQHIIRWKYKLNAEPVDRGNIIQGRYFVANWTRIG